MGIVRSIKKIFKNSKKEGSRLSDLENARMEQEHHGRITKKSKQVNRQKVKFWRISHFLPELCYTAHIIKRAPSGFSQNVRLGPHLMI